MKRLKQFAAQFMPWYFFVSTAVLDAAAQWSARPPNNAGPSTPALELEKSAIWEKELGEGFKAATTSFGLSAGANAGMAVFGGREAHDLALVNISYGHMLGRTVGQGHWYQGNPELRLELFTGAEFSPNREWLVGLAPHLRYNFATGSRWIPFADLGAGVTATGIGPPDLSGTFEFNLQAGGGVHWFFKRNCSLTAEARYLHWSCAGLNKPNLGLNGVTGLLGVTLFR